MATLMLVIYYSFILVVAFAPQSLATPISADTVISIGVPIGVAILITCFVFTGIYVRKANNDYDALTEKVKEAMK